VFGKSRLITIESEFDEPRFAPGHVYFLNTQKIGRDKKLVSPGDRTSTIWETIARTAEESPESFWVVIDEAHRGMRGEEDDPDVAGSITQKFILGSPGEIPAVRLILGISATPERFAAKLAGLTRTQRPHVISPEEVRSSGLIKDWITVYHPEQSQPSDYTLLQAAAAKLKEFERAWDGFSAAEKEAVRVEPLLVVQVDDAPTGGKAITKTDIEEALRAIEIGLGRTLAEHEIGHACRKAARSSSATASSST
jgi:type III restriction enzyme